MNNFKIKQNFYKKNLKHYHTQKDTFIIEELGLNHGKNRADIAVLNGRFIGYEIKSNSDSLRRLKEQVKSYNAIFDEVYIVVGNRYVKTIHKHLPSWWGIINVIENSENDIDFNIIREARTNRYVEPISIARLLWRNEVLEILKEKQIHSKILREPRAVLYQRLADTMNISEIRKTVRNFLIRRKNWRCPVSLFQYDDLCQPVST